MHLFGGGARKDREHLVTTLRSLGPTSLAGLSAALSWSERRTEKTVQEAIRWGEGALRFDPVTRSVAWNSPVPTPVAAPPVPAAPPVRPAPLAPPPLPKAWGASAKCPACQVAFVTTGTGGGLYCPQCGRLSHVPPTAASSAPAPPAPAAVAVPGPSRAPEPPVGADRRSQEMFAAWVTARPIPCPKCRTPLRHRGVAQYACPACGAQVTFSPPPSLVPPAGSAAPPLPMPPAPSSVGPMAPATATGPR
jgi:predicted RNA-binding Zn-ribbon protein involved in translation (DUF1610 family)